MQLLREHTHDFHFGLPLPKASKQPLILHWWLAYSCFHRLYDAIATTKINLFASI